MKIKTLTSETENVLIMLVGLPGSGKSSITRSILDKNPDMDFEVISSDNIIVELGESEGLSYKESFEKYIGKATGDMWIRAKQAKNNGKNIIWDQTNLTPKSRKKKLELFKHYTKISIICSPTEPELKERLKKREREDGKEVPDHIIKSMSRTFKMPSKDEGFSKIKVIK